MAPRRKGKAQPKADKKNNKKNDKKNDDQSKHEAPDAPAKNTRSKGAAIAQPGRPKLQQSGITSMLRSRKVYQFAPQPDKDVTRTEDSAGKKDPLLEQWGKVARRFLRLPTPSPAPTDEADVATEQESEAQNDADEDETEHQPTAQDVSSGAEEDIVENLSDILGSEKEQGDEIAAAETRIFGSAVEQPNPDEGKVTVRPREDPPQMTDTAQASAPVPGSLGEAVAAPTTPSFAGPRFKMRAMNPTNVILRNMSDRDRANYEYLRKHGPRKSIRTAARERVKDAEDPEQPEWENTHQLAFLPRSVGAYVSTEDNILPTEDAPTLPHVPKQPVRPKFQIPVGRMTGDRGFWVTRPNKQGFRTKIDRSGMEAYLRLTSRGCVYEFCDETGQHTTPAHIWFDAEHRGVSRHLQLARDLMAEFQEWEKIYDKWGDDMREWRIRMRRAELEWWRHQIEAGNWKLFNPETVNPRTAQFVYDGLCSWVDAENARDRDGGYPNAFRGRPRRREVQVGYQGVENLEKEHGPENPAIVLDKDLLSGSERLGMINRANPADKTGLRLWKLGARIVNRQRGEQILLWEANGSEGPRPFDPPEGMTREEAAEWAIRYDEEWGTEVMKQVRAITRKELGADVFAEDEVPENEPATMGKPKTPKTPKTPRTPKTPTKRKRQSSRIASKADKDSAKSSKTSKKTMAAGGDDGEKGSDSDKDSSNDDKKKKRKRQRKPDDHKSIGKKGEDHDDDSDDDFGPHDDAPQTQDEGDNTPERKAATQRSASGKKVKFDSGLTKAELNKKALAAGQAQHHKAKALVATAAKEIQDAKMTPEDGYREHLAKILEESRQRGKWTEDQLAPIVSVEEFKNMGCLPKGSGVLAANDVGAANRLRDRVFGRDPAVAVTAELEYGEKIQAMREAPGEPVIAIKAHGEGFGVPREWWYDLPKVPEPVLPPRRTLGEPNEAEKPEDEVEYNFEYDGSESGGWSPDEEDFDEPTEQQDTTSKPADKPESERPEPQQVEPIVKVSETSEQRTVHEEVATVETGDMTREELQAKIAAKEERIAEIRAQQGKLPKRSAFQREYMKQQEAQLRKQQDEKSHWSGEHDFGPTKVMPQQTTLYIPVLERPDAGDALDRMAKSDLTLVLPELSNDEYLTGTFPFRQREAVMREIKDAAANWIGNRQWDVKKIREYNIRFLTSWLDVIVVNDELLSYEQAVKWAPVKLLSSEPLGDRRLDRWHHKFALERADDGLFICKRIEAAHLQHPNSVIEAVAPRELMEEKRNHNADFWSALGDMNGWYNRDDEARHKGLNYRGEAGLERADVFWGQPRLMQGFRNAMQEEMVPADIQEWIEKGAPHDISLRPGTSGLRSYRPSPPTPTMQKRPAVVVDLDDLSDVDPDRELPPLIRLSPEIKRESLPSIPSSSSDEDDDGVLIDKENVEKRQPTLIQPQPAPTELQSTVTESISGLPSPLPTQDIQIPAPNTRMRLREIRVTGELDISPGAEQLLNELFSQTLDEPELPLVPRTQTVQQGMLGMPPKPVARVVTISEDIPDFNSNRWYAHPRFTLPNDFPTVYGVVKRKSLLEGEFERMAKDKPGLFRVWTNAEGRDFFEMRNLETPIPNGRQILRPRYPWREDIRRYVAINVDREGRFEFVEWSDFLSGQENEIGPVYNDKGLRVPWCNLKTIDGNPQRHICGNANWNREQQIWENTKNRFTAVPKEELSTTVTPWDVLVRIRKGFCVRTSVHSSESGLQFDVEARYPWDRRGRLRFEPVDGKGEELDPATIVRPLNIPLKIMDSLDMGSTKVEANPTERQQPEPEPEPDKSKIPVPEAGSGPVTFKVEESTSEALESQPGPAMSEEPEPKTPELKVAESEWTPTPGSRLAAMRARMRGRGGR